jgi:hypothetical protein
MEPAYSQDQNSVDTPHQLLYALAQKLFRLGSLYFLLPRTSVESCLPARGLGMVKEHGYLGSGKGLHHGNSLKITELLSSRVNKLNYALIIYKCFWEELLYLSVNNQV